MRSIASLALVAAASLVGCAADPASEDETEESADAVKQAARWRMRQRHQGSRSRLFGQSQRHSRAGHTNERSGVHHDDKCHPSKRERLFDCTTPISFDRFAVVAGHHSQFFTHGIDVTANLQRSQPITVGEYSMVGTRCTLLARGRVSPPAPFLVQVPSCGRQNRVHSSSIQACPRRP